MNVLATAFILALFIQLLTGRFKRFISNKNTEIVAIAIGIILCLVYQAGILQMLGLTATSINFSNKWLGEILINFAFIDYILSGIAISGGASGIYDLGKNLLEILQKPKEGQV